MRLDHVPALKALHVLYLLVPNTGNPELSHPAGWRVAEKGVRPREEVQGTAPKPGCHPIPVPVRNYRP